MLMVFIQKNQENVVKNIKIDNGKSFNWGKTSESYAKYRDIYPSDMYTKLYNAGVGHKGQKWLDMGTGTGILPKAMYSYGADIYGIDIASQQVDEAKRIAGELGMNITYMACPAEKTGFPDNFFDVITACQCFMYFDKNLVVPEIKRILKPGGTFLKIYMFWLKEDVIAMQSKELVNRFNPDWLTGTPMVDDMKTHYFEVKNMDSFYADIPFTRESWAGRMRATRGVEAAMTSDQVEQFDKAHRQLLADIAPPEFSIRHKIYITEYQI